jgi:hypothetical protein
VCLGASRFGADLFEPRVRTGEAPAEDLPCEVEEVKQPRVADAVSTISWLRSTASCSETTD